MQFKYQELEDSIVKVIRESVEGKDVGVAFSGGLDSGLVSAIAKKYANSVTLYTCGTDKAYDVVFARGLSEKLELPWVHAPISKANLEECIRGLVVAGQTSDPFTISYELPLYCVCATAKEDVILTGQGADEFFMGCAKFVESSGNDYEILKSAGVERLLGVSIPCEKNIANYFGKEMAYVYTQPAITNEVAKIDPEVLRPKDMDSRKQVLKDIALHLGYPHIAEMKKKSSQYGSGTTDLIRNLSKAEGKMYNEYIASLYDDEMKGAKRKERGAVIYARIDPIIKAEAEKILQQQGSCPSEVIEELYREIIKKANNS